LDSIQTSLKARKKWTEQKLIKILASILKCLVDYEKNDYFNGLVIPELVVITKYNDVKLVDPVFCYEKTEV
jgi:hypothetical protein